MAFTPVPIVDRTDPGGGGGGGASAINDLTDVDTATDPPDADDVLAWDGVMWTPATLAALGAPGLSNAAPHVLGTAAPGVSTEASRADHVHDLPTAADVGAAASLHVHSGADITSGTVSTARLGTGAANATTFLRGDQTWAAAGGSETLPASIIDAAGDLIIGTAADTVGRLPLGARGRTLVAGATAPEWKSVGVIRSYGGMPAKAGEWILLLPSGTIASTANQGTTTSNSNNVVRYVPFEVGKRVGVSGLGLEITAANDGASAVLRLGILVSNDGRPGVVAAQGSASINVADTKEITWTEVFLEPGWHWAAFAMQNLNTSGTNPAYRTTGATTTAQSSRSTVPSGSTTAHNQTVRASSLSGAYTDNPTVSQEIGGPTPSLWMKVSTL